MNVRLLCLVAGLFVLVTLPAGAAVSEKSTPLDLNQYLNQVRGKNLSFKGSQAGSEGSEMRSEESVLLFAPTVYSNFQFTSDQKLPLIPVFTYDEQNTTNFTLGVSQQTTFGLLAKISYNVFYNNYINLQIPGAGGSPPGASSYYITTPMLELSQSLWSNSFGSGNRANRDLLEAQALASSYSSRYVAKATLVQAESAYWRLAADRQTITAEKQALDRAQKLYDLSLRRAKLQLADQADALQAEAALDLRKLDMQSALDEERSASRAFNMVRNLDSDVVEENVMELSPEQMDHLSLPEKAELRDDVKAARESARAAVANSLVADQRDRPQLDIFGSFALNGHTGDFSSSLGDPFSAHRPTESVGLRFQAPLDIGALGRARAGWKLEQTSAELSFQQKVLDQDQNWKDLTQKLDESKRRLTLVRKLETAQDSKLKHERDRLSKGRTTTYQVLLFEEDFASSQIARIRAQLEVLNVYTQMKLFGEKL